MKICLVFLALFLLTGCGNDHVSTTGKNTNDTVFLKRVLKDTPYPFYHAIYIDTTSVVGNRETLTDFSFDNFDSTTYFRDLPALQPFTKINSLPDGFSRKWVLLYPYKNEYYTYVPSEAGAMFRFEITDSTTIDHSMEGAEPSWINKITQTEPGKLVISRTNFWQGKTVEINLINPGKGIAIFTFGPTKYSPSPDKQLMVSVEKMHGFKTIINYCKTDKMGEFDFDEINFKELEQKKP